MSAPQRSKVKKIQTSYVIQQEKQEYKKTQRRKKKVIRFSIVATMALAASSLFLYTMMVQSSMIDEQIKTKEQLEEKLHTLQQDEKRLKEEIKKLNDDQYIAELARKQYFLSKEGEIIFITPDE
ncbi:FtsB family cell division protein [Anoxybacillus flavithermus]|uniref:Septum formation initiator n=1 Tax=Anoxybacillus flavithermus (strain DSM 21510 / WK1) TaxID=491915 RepID=B7GFI9_ANOFW|nr:septum formation initiator family protein [Anoxybacillus flavithermus]ACJ32439.1 Septum formation initiator [Anoxybacillus flavithermus WK1]AST05863.1 septation inhibitor protein [Anoxybacillus flavithermus]